MTPNCGELLFILLPLAMMGLTGLIIFRIPQLWTRSVGVDDRHRNHTMDGVRGLLSLWVLTHHLTAIPFLMGHPTAVSIQAHAPQSAVASLMASSFFTAPFYTLTAMLFGGSLLASGGSLNTKRFYTNRVFRLAPVYVLSILIVVSTAFFMTGFHLHVSSFKLLATLVRWCSFGFLAMYDINGAKVASWHGMLWTLPYEIAFYLMLPVLAWGQRKAKSPLALFGGLAAVGLFAWPFIFFTAGVIAAAMTSWKHRYAPLIWSVMTVVSLTLIGVTAAASGPILQAALLLPILVAAATQAPLLRPFRIKAMRFIGEISYSIYILHYPLICIIFALIIDPDRINGSSYLSQVGILTIIGTSIILVSALSYMLLERPFIQIGKRLKS